MGLQHPIEATMRTNLVLMMVCVGATIASGCIGYERRSTLSPTLTGSATLVGSWASSSATGLPAPSTCTNFKWNVTEQTGNTASGTFSATCAGNLQVTGTAHATLSGSTVTWNATASASVPDLPSCPITLNGTAELGVDSIRVPYSGQTCLGAVSGVEVLRKN
jgi:hypothetical protein